MIKHFHDRAVAVLAATACCILLAGCGTPAPKNFSDKWRPVNHFQDHATKIPLSAAYTFYAAPMDETLKSMLTRWAKDSGRQLAYQPSFDVTLFQPVAAIRTTDIHAAATQLNGIYAAQNVVINADDHAIRVTRGIGAK